MFLRKKDELISDILLWNPSHRQTGVGQPARIYNTSVRTKICSLEGLSEAMDDRDEWRERGGGKEIRARHDDDDDDDDDDLINGTRDATFAESAPCLRTWNAMRFDRHRLN